MSFRYTPLHRELGLQSGDLTWEVILTAITQATLERTDLDWKREAYDRKKADDDLDELAKDVAAMANSGGGLLVLGILEDRKTSAALRVHEQGVRLSDSDQRSYRQRVASATRPAITGIEFLVVESGDAQHAVTLMAVPDSLDAPHLVVMNKDPHAFKAPFRDGPQSQWMPERLLESAYRSRFDGRGSYLARCEELYQEAADNSHAANRLCFIAAAVPEVPRPSALGRPSAEEVRQLLLEAKATANQGMHKGAALSPLNDPQISYSAFQSARPGHRRRVVREDNEDGDYRHRSLTCSLHDDGSVSMAWSLGGMHTSGLCEPNETSAMFVESAVIDFVATVSSAAHRLGVGRSYSLMVGLVFAGSRPIVLRPLGWGLDMEPGGPASARRFLPARDSLAIEHDKDDLVSVAQRLALDCVSQCGVWWLNHLP